MVSGRGRPRDFDADVVLDRALKVFWRHGFQDASLADLTEAMGLSKPSLYAAFGDKEALYLKVLERYAAQQIKHHTAILDNEPDGRRAMEKFLRSVVSMQTDPTLPGGCFIVNGTADSGGSSMPVAVEQALRNALQGAEEKLRERLTRAQRDGQLAQEVRVEDLATFFCTLIAGLGVRAKSGAMRAKLDTVIDAAMAIWPKFPASDANAHPSTKN